MTARAVLAGVVFSLAAIFAPHTSQAAGASGEVPDLGTTGAWKACQWNKASGKIEISGEFPEELKAKGSSLCLKVYWAGGEGMRFFSVVPAKQDPLKAKVSKASIWVKGSGNSRYVELHFLANGQEKDAGGKFYKIGMGQMNFTDWRKLETQIPADWPQPLTIKSVTFHDWNIPQPVDDTFYLARFELN
jgi:hypothetical protein